MLSFAKCVCVSVCQHVTEVLWLEQFCHIACFTQPGVKICPWPSLQNDSFKLAVLPNVARPGKVLKCFTNRDEGLGALACPAPERRTALGSSSPSLSCWIFKGLPWETCSLVQWNRLQKPSYPWLRVERDRPSPHNGPLFPQSPTERQEGMGHRQPLCGRIKRFPRQPKGVQITQPCTTRTL